MKTPRLAWIDLETTGLHLECEPIEIACVLTDADLEPIADFHRLITPTAKGVSFAQPVAQAMHEKSGLWKECQEWGVPAGQADAELTEWLSHCASKGVLIMAGNSIHFDRRVMKQQMPLTDAFLHYRQLDVTTVKVLAQLWWPEVSEPKKNKAHTALADIKESISELKYWKARGIFQTPFTPDLPELE